MRKLLILTTLLLAFGAVAAIADCGGCGSSHGAKAIKTKAKTVSTDGEEMTVTGTLVCMGCTLKKDGAKSACSDFGCSHALKTPDGKYISLLQNRESATLIKGETLHNKKVTLSGTYFANANIIDVDSFAEVGGKTQSWCEGHKSMDACAAK